MGQFRQYLKYNDPIVITWRSGDIDDSYVDIYEELKVVNNRFVLSEIPDEFNHVQIVGFTEIQQDPYGEVKKIQPNEFKMNYTNGIGFVDNSHEGETLQVSYLGRGIVQYPAERIYVHSPNPYAVENLQEFIELAQLRIAEVNLAIAECNKATNAANEATENANNVILEMENLKVEVIQATDNANTATQAANEATNAANEATQAAIEKRDELERDRLLLRLDWHDPVADFPSISATYDNPEVGWAVMTKDTGNLYRWNGLEWRLIGNMVGAVPVATENIDGLISKEMFIKLNGIEDGAEVNLEGEDAKNVLPDYFKIRTMVFVFPGEVQDGLQSVFLQFPWNGILKSIRALCGTIAGGSTEIVIEKIGQADFPSDTNWINICEKNLFIPESSRTDDGEWILSSDNTTVNQNDYFRITIPQVGNGLKNLTIEIDVEI